MKVTVEVDCTPEEARRFFGLPDLTSLHEAYLDRLRTAVEQGITPDMINTMIKTWGPMGEAGLSVWKQMLDRLGGAAHRS